MAVTEEAEVPASEAPPEQPVSLARLLELAARKTVGAVIEVKATDTRAVAPVSKKAPDRSKTQIGGARLIDRRATSQRLSLGESR